MAIETALIAFGVGFGAGVAFSSSYFWGYRSGRQSDQRRGLGVGGEELPPPAAKEPDLESLVNRKKPEEGLLDGFE